MRKNEIEGLRRRLSGPALKDTLRAAGTNKSRLARETGVAYSTLCFWQNGTVKPSEDLAVRVGRHLGLVASEDPRIDRLQQKIREIQKQIEELRA